MIDKTIASFAAALTFAVVATTASAAGLGGIGGGGMGMGGGGMGGMRISNRAATSVPAFGRNLGAGRRWGRDE